ncbi:MAG: hypothetical protein A3H27_18420 [Acidobacteria bacterium RIFCSPLOWO2_02_FULL_59_13]|nr:MAG: hypothetical protein A3H27_18420 [Acidobacteria bacterium RIFCSPLOWO2_02_FULL_59_13]
MQAFSVGQAYERSQLLEFVGSKQQQTGIIWGPRESGCVICTSGGRHSKKAGYEDGPTTNGSWRYYGQGGRGDQSISSFANGLLSNGDKTVLLFLTKEPGASQVKSQGNYRKQYEFAGAFHVASYDKVRATAGPRRGDLLIRFDLIPVQETMLVNARDQHLDSGDLGSLREAALKDSAGRNRHESIVSYRRRSVSVRSYAQFRAGGACEWCKNNAPFVDLGGSPFLEVHHIFRLADDGPDLPSNVAALCPNCHRAAHFSGNRVELQASLAKRVLEIEAVIEKRLTCGENSYAEKASN